MDHGHVDALGTLGVSIHLVGGQNHVEILAVLLFLLSAYGFGFPLGVIPASGYTGDLAEFLYGRRIK